MSSPFDQNLLPEFESIRDRDEQILWTARPRFVPFIFSGLGISLYMIVFSILWITLVSQGSGFFWMVGLLPLAQGLYIPLRKLLVYGNTFYAYSNKRVMIRTGFIGTDFKTIDYDKISDIEVTVNVIERIFNVGTIKYFSGRTESDDKGIKKIYDRWEAIPFPYEVFKRVKEVTVDIKTDYNYPNALRPSANPGYNTKYEKYDKLLD